MSTRTPQEAVKAACALIGGQRALARALDLTQQTVRGWIAGDAPVPAKQAARIEHLTAGAVPAFETAYTDIAARVDRLAPALTTGADHG